MRQTSNGHGTPVQNDQDFEKQTTKETQKETHRLIANGKTKNSEAENEKSNQEIIIPFFSLFRFADKLDILMMTVGCLSAIMNGISFPGNMMFFTHLMDISVKQGHFRNLLESIPAFLEANNFSSHDVFVHGKKFLLYCDEMYNYSGGLIKCDQLDIVDNLADEMYDFCIKFTLIATVVFVCASLQVIMFMISSQRQILRLRQQCFRNILRQEVAWFDDNKPGELSVRMTEEITNVHSAIGDGLPLTLQWGSSALCGLAMSLGYGWQLSLAMLSVVPLFAGSSAVVGKFQTKLAVWERDAYAQAGVAAEEALSSLRTVVAFGGQENEVKRYTKNLEVARTLGIKRGLVGGLGLGILWMSLYLGYGLGFYYGAKLVRHGDYSVKDMMAVFFTTFLGALGLGFAVPAAETITGGRAAAYKVYQILDRKPTIDSSSPDGLRLGSLSGDVEFRNVHFSYPSRPTSQILRGLDLRVSSGQTVALVGASGCGKSTAVQLLLRFYNPCSGRVCIDGHDIDTLNLKWLRQQIGLVSQEPVLFATTIAENIRHGLDGVTMGTIVKACKEANAYSFIMNLPKQFDTYVGEGGAQLSGGQKQRIAIARALVKNPKILLLDEATSALDTESEVIVQDALDKASKGRTTIVIAHRLSTVRNADVIVAFSEGQIAEKGTHEELIAENGIYAQLVATQMSKPYSQYDTDDNQDTCLDSVGEVKMKHSDAETHINNSTSVKQSDNNHEKINELTAKASDWATKIRLFKLNSPEWQMILLGSLASFCNGSVDPVWGVIFGEATKALSEDDMGEQRRQMNKLSLAAVGLGVISLVTRFLQEFVFAVTGESLTRRIREIYFRAMLKQNMSWFDDQQNNTAVLTTKLATEAPKVQMATGVTLGQFIQCSGSLILGMVFSLYYGWKLGLPLLVFVPFIVGSGFLQIRIIHGLTTSTAKHMESATTAVMESVRNIRTVAALTREEEFQTTYVESLTVHLRSIYKFCVGAGLIYGFSQSVYYLSFVLSFYVGAKLINSDDIEFYDMFRVFCCIALTAMNMGRSLGAGPETAEATKTAVSIFQLIDTVPSIDETKGKALTLQQNTFESSVRFDSVHFHYPMRPGVAVLNGLKLSVKPGQTLALVGASGCGKSTTVQLIERFYDTVSGTVYFDKYDIKDLNVQWLRSNIGLVSQEPMLFDRSVKENIAYGDNSRHVDMQEIIEAARSANIHGFIEALPLGYETNVGSKGTQLSGGQKQRIAIARALVRNPKILLLDEATSALDTESEKVVQKALDKARKGRTCIIIAHRLSTVKDADKIAVLKGGVVHEMGTHDQLIALRGLYYQLVTAQSKKS